MEDKRDVPRESVKIKKIFRLLVGDQRREICLVQDVSPFGAGIQIDGCVSKGTDVRLQLETDKELIAVAGFVVWTQKIKHATHPYRVGIEFTPSSAKENAIFYRKLIEAE